MAGLRLIMTPAATSGRCTWPRAWAANRNKAPEILLHPQPEDPANLSARQRREQRVRIYQCSADGCQTKVAPPSKASASRTTPPAATRRSAAPREAVSPRFPSVPTKKPGARQKRFDRSAGRRRAIIRLACYFEEAGVIRHVRPLPGFGTDQNQAGGNQRPCGPRARKHRRQTPPFPSRLHPGELAPSPGRHRAPTRPVRFTARTPQWRMNSRVRGRSASGMTKHCFPAPGRNMRTAVTSSRSARAVSLLRRLRPR